MIESKNKQLQPNFVHNISKFRNTVTSTMNIKSKIIYIIIGKYVQQTLLL